MTYLNVVGGSFSSVLLMFGIYGNHLFVSICSILVLILFLISEELEEKRLEEKNLKKTERGKR